MAAFDPNKLFLIQDVSYVVSYLVSVIFRRPIYPQYIPHGYNVTYPNYGVNMNININNGK